MKRFLAFGCLFLFASMTAAGQVSFTKERRSMKLDTNTEIVLWYSGQSQQPNYSLYISYGSGEKRQTVSMSLGDSKNEAHRRLEEMKEACATGSDFTYKDHLKLTLSFHSKGGGVYDVWYYPHHAYINVSCFDEAINWLKNVNE